MRLLILLLTLIFTVPAQSGTLAEFTFETEAQSQDFRELISKMRCLVCQNESLAGSNAELAQDLRKEIYEMVKAGKSHDEVIEFMVARYGDFVLYDPPVKPSTYPLWFGPLVLLIIGALLLFRALRRKTRSSETEITDEEARRLQQLLNSTSDSKDANK